MNFRSVLHVLGALLFFVGASMLFPIGFSLYYGDGDVQALIISLCLSLICGATLWLLTSNPRELQIREGFAVVTFGWVLFSAFGALPFVLCHAGISFTDAFFETMSGFTTTGATILTDVESLPHGVLFWRSLTHWIGGMGIILLSLAILPMLGVGGMQMFKAEVPGPSADKLQPRVQDTAKILWGVYVLLSCIEAVLLQLGGMTFFDALCHTFGTMATGGFSTKNAGIPHFESAYIENVISVFMIMAGTSFALHYLALKGKWRNYWASSEFRFYIGIIAFVTLFLFVDLFANIYQDVPTATRKAIFQTVSILTTTGFHSADYETWSVPSQLILVIIMFFGGCAGSTGGGVKIIRILVAAKSSVAQFKKLLHPHAVIPIRVGNMSISKGAASDIIGFLVIYIAIFVVSALLMSLLGLDLTSAASTVISTLSNIGPGIGSIGPTENFAHIPAVGKWFLSFLMLVGRLEIFTVLVLFNRNFWSK